MDLLNQHLQNIQRPFVQSSVQNNVQYRQPRADNLQACQAFAQTIGFSASAASIMNNTCMVLGTRDIGPVQAPNGHVIRTPHLNVIGFSYETDAQGRVFNAGETVILQEEADTLIKELSQRNISVTGLHNHWNLTTPFVLYIHFVNLDQTPQQFARNVADAFNVVRNNRNTTTLRQSINRS